MPIEQIYKGGESKARNQRMQNMFRMIGYGENLGSGFPLILNAWNEKHWIKPELQEQPELMQVKLTLHIQNEPTNEPVNEPVNERQQTILSIMKQSPSIIYNKRRFGKQTGYFACNVKKRAYFVKEGRLHYR